MIAIAIEKSRAKTRKIWNRMAACWNDYGPCTIPRLNRTIPSFGRAEFLREEELSMSRIATAIQGEKR